MSQRFDNNYRSLGSYMPSTSIPIVSAVPEGVSIIPVFSNINYQNPNYNILTDPTGSQNNYISVSQAYMTNCPDGNCVKYVDVKNPCNTKNSKYNDENSRI